MMSMSCLDDDRGHARGLRHRVFVRSFIVPWLVVLSCRFTERRQLWSHLYHDHFVTFQQRSVFSAELPFQGASE